MTRRTRNWLIALLAIYCIPVIIVGGIVAFMALRPLPPLVPLPNPNAYDDLAKAGRLVSSQTRDYAKLNVNQLRPIVESNAPALSLARDFLDSQCRVPVQYSQEDQQNNAVNYTKLRSLSLAFAAEGRLAEIEKRTGKAAQCDMDLIRLGADTARGGILVDALVGNAIESLGTADLARLVNQLDARTCRESAATIEMLDAQKASWTEVLKQEDGWIRRTFGVKAVVVEIVVHQQMKRNGTKMQKNYLAEQLKLRRLELDLASRAYELDKGHRPASAADLAPEYLKAVPKHPTIGKNLN
jgi:hypothetical protein